MHVARRSAEPSPHPGDLRDPRRPVVSVARDEPRGAHFPTHRHFRAQLVYASDGVMQVTTAGGTWVVPPQQAVWMPAGIDHDVFAEGPVSMRSLYVHPQAARGLGDECRVVLVEPLLRELILKVVELARKDETGESYARLAGVVLDQLRDLKPAPLHLPLPRDARLRAITGALLDDPGDERDLAAWGRHVGASGRTLARLFRRETAMTFAGWRRRLRLLAAISRLAAGQPVTTVAYDLGYRSPSAFVAMFRRVLGTPPGKYLKGS